MDPITIVTVLALGLGIGIIVGLTSVGSGALMTPILYLDFSSALARNLVVGTASAQGTIIKFAASARNYYRKKLRPDYAFMIAITGVPFAVIGALFSTSFITFNLFSPLLALVLLAVGVLIIVQQKASKISHTEDPKMTVKLKRKGWAIGIVIGLIAGLTGVATGSLLVSSLMLILKFPNRTAVSIAIFEGGLILFAAAATQFYLGHIDIAFTGILLLGGIPGVLIGSHYKDRINQKLLGYGIAGVIIFESARTISAFLTGKSFFFF